MGDENQFEILRSEEARNLIQSAVPSQARLQLWTAGQKHSCIGRIHRINESGESLFIAIPKEGACVDFEDRLRRDGIEEVLMSLHLPTDMLYFKGILKRADASAFQIKVEPPVYKLQRRRAVRIPFVDANAPAVTIHLSASDEMPITAKLANVSEGGIGILAVSESDFKRLPSGKKLARIQFKLGALEITAAGEVKHVQDVAATGRMRRQMKIGIAFTALDSGTRDRLTRYVFESAAKFLGRL